MDFWILAIRIIFLSQTTIGILGNVSLMFYYLVLYYRECTLKPSDLILLHLMTANAMTIFSLGVPHTMAVFGLMWFFNDLGCRMVIYIQTVSRSVSIGTTCLLSVFQTMTVRPREFSWKDYKVKGENYIGCSISLLWVFNMLIHFIFFVYPFITHNRKNMTGKRDFGYCSTIGSDEISDSLYAAMVVCPEVFFSVCIALSSGSMIVILYRHKKRVQHIRSSHGYNRTSPESRATQNILVLVSTFLAFYSLSSILRGCIALLYNHSWWLVNITPFISLCFPSFGPFVLMNRCSIVYRLTLIWIRNKNNLIFFKVHK
ncbi:vomeronasal type-1 receptor 4-like [Peromyscus californicus insignis]|uniref:vomeronasal type-1 receptor 4-like n=1 Tax=Peromyscus californicus insignis TaxID=564181 RepID=UPI0022A7526D|nr:vomeronasal type-1 receptor 4-like [Peromyscus californicus insignis]